MRKALINRLGLLGVVGFLSYAAAVVFSPLAYPGYDWMSRAVSDLSALNAPSLALWNQLNALSLCGILCAVLVCVYVQDKLSPSLRTGIYLFTVMQFVSSVGFTMFPLTDAGYTDAASNVSDALQSISANFQDTMHIAVTAVVIALSIASLLCIIIGGYQKRHYVSLAVWATIALVLMMAGGIGTGVVPKEVFGLFQRFSNFSATGFPAVLGVYLFTGFKGFRQ